MAYTYTILYHLMPPICGHTGDWLCGSHDPQSRICEAPFVRLGLALEWPYGPETPLACWKFMSMRSDMMPSWAEICRNDWHDDWNPGKPCEIQCSCIIYIHLWGSVWDLPSEYIHQKYKKIIPNHALWIWGHGILPWRPNGASVTKAREWARLLRPGGRARVFNGDCGVSMPQRSMNSPAMNHYPLDLVN